MLILLALLTCISTTTYTMENDTPLIAQFPQEIIGHIACALNKVIGKTSFINYEDLPVITKYIRALAWTNKKNYVAINSPEITKLLIEGIAKRFDISPEQAAANLNTKGARTWLKTTQHYALFCTLLEAFKFPLFTFLNVNKRTNDGLLKDNSKDSSQSNLYTPWGSIYEYFLSKPNTITVEENALERVVKYGIVEKHYFYDRITKINEKNIPVTKDLYYKEVPEYFPSESIIKKTWNTLKNMQDQEKNIPGTSHAPSSPTKSMNAPHDQNGSHLSNITNIKNIDDIAQWCASVVNSLSKKTNNTLSFNELHLIENIHRIAFKKETLEELENIPYLHSISIYNPDGEKVGLSTSNEYPSVFSHDQLETFYTSVIENLKTGWKLEKLEKHPTIWFKQSEEEWQLLIKLLPSSYETPIWISSVEHEIVNSIAHKCGFPGHTFICNQLWVNQYNYSTPKYLYVWVKKKYWEQFQEIFKLNVSSTNNN